MDTLSTLPPELLLQILTHLPTSTSLLPLSQTSSFYRSFLATHATTISNNLILTHYPLASTILHSTYSSSGWLIPSHPLISTTESRLRREKILLSKCRCLSCRRVLYQQPDASNSSLELADFAILGLPCLPHITGSCRVKEELQHGAMLSEPGPQYLVFLEKYAWEVELRWGMMMPKPQPNVLAIGVEDDDEGGGLGAIQEIPEEMEDEDEKVGGLEGAEVLEEKKREFEFMIGTHCVRRFIEDVNRELSHITATPATIIQQQKKERSTRKCFPWKKRQVEGEGQVIEGQRPRTARSSKSFKSVKGLWKKRTNSSSTTSSSLQPQQQNGNGNGRETSPQRRMMFGEIQSPVESTGDGIGSGNEKVGSLGAEERPGLVGRMLWVGELRNRIRERVESESNESKKEGACKETKKSLGKYTEQFKHGIKALGNRIGRVFTNNKGSKGCVGILGGFQSLDD